LGGKLATSLTLRFKKPMTEFFTHLGRLWFVGLGVIMFFPQFVAVLPGVLLWSIPLAAFITLGSQETRLKEMEAKSQGPGLKTSTPASVDNAKTKVKNTPDPEPDIIQQVDVNVADEMSIAKLPTIGPIVAKRIIQERNIRPFQSLDDLESRCGLKPHQVMRLRPIVEFGSASKSSGLFARIFQRKQDEETGQRGDQEVSPEQKRKGRIVDY